MEAIGQLQTKKTVYCEICGCSRVRNISVKVFENTEEKIESAKNKLREKANAKYICRICKTIIK